MSGNNNPYDPTKMFQDWIQKSGHAQAEFIKGFGSLMATSQPAEAFNPLATLQKMSKVISDGQWPAGGMSFAMDERTNPMLGLGQMFSAFTSWGAYKTTLSSNGRISIPESERTALGIGEGDLVQVIILPIPKRTKREEEVNK